MQAVEVESVKSGFAIRKRLFVIMFTQPANEIEYIGVAPHPLWETLETAQRIDAVDIGTLATDVAINSISVGPVGLYRDSVEAPLVDEPLGDESAFSIKFVGAMTRFTEQDKACFAHHLDK